MAIEVAGSCTVISVVREAAQSRVKYHKGQDVRRENTSYFLKKPKRRLERNKKEMIEILHEASIRSKEVLRLGKALQRHACVDKNKRRRNRR